MTICESINGNNNELNASYRGIVIAILLVLYDSSPAWMDVLIFFFVLGCLPTVAVVQQTLLGKLSYVSGESISSNCIPMRRSYRFTLNVTAAEAIAHQYAPELSNLTTFYYQKTLEANRPKSKSNDLQH